MNTQPHLTKQDLTKFPKAILSKLISEANAHYKTPIHINPLGIIVEYSENAKYWGAKFYHEEIKHNHNITEEGEGYSINSIDWAEVTHYLYIAINKVTNNVVKFTDKKVVNV